MHQANRPADRPASRAIATVDVTPSDRAHARRLVTVVRMGAKGTGLVAKRDLPAFTALGPYPGELLTSRQHAKRRDAGLTDSKFAVDYWRPNANGVRSGYVIDPGTAAGTLHPRFSAAVAPLVNEPGLKGTPNVIWIWNLPKDRLELWTSRAVRQGEELTVCYGTDGGYARSYRTACVARQGQVEPELHVITRPRAKPVPYSSLGNAGVRAAWQALR